MVATVIPYTAGAVKTQGFDTDGKPLDPGWAIRQRLVAADATSVAPAGTAEEIVATISFTAKALARVGLVLHGIIYGLHAANTNSAILQARIGAAGIIASGGTVIATRTSIVSGDVLKLEFYLYVTGLATQICIGSGTSTDKVANTAAAALTLDTTTALDLIITCTNGTAAADLALKMTLLDIQ